MLDFRIGDWHQIDLKIAPDIWAPDIRFLNLINMDPIILAGKNNKHYEFWLQKTEAGALMQMYQSFKVEFACDFHFYEYPFDSHSCVLNYGMPMYSNRTILMDSIKVLMNDTNVKELEQNEYVSIPNNHLPYEFSLTISESILVYNYGYYSPHGTIVIKAKRNTLGTLIGQFFVPTGIFALLSIISYLISYEMVSHFLKQDFWLYMILQIDRSLEELAFLLPYF